MPIPPKYGDVGKQARDVFGKNYHFGLWKLDVKHATQSQVKFNTVLSSDTASGKTNGSLETKYNWKDYGLTFTEKWNTDNVISTDLSVEDQLVKGLKLSFENSFQPTTGKKTGCIKGAYKRDYVNLGTDVDFDFAGPTIHSSGVFGYKGWLAGAQLSFDTAKSQLTKNNFVAGYQGDDFELTANCNDGREFGGSLYHKLNRDFEAGVSLAWAAGNTPTRFCMGTKYRVSPETSIQAKVSNRNDLGLSLTQTLADSVSVTASALIDGKSLNTGGHKVGLCVSMGE